MSHQMIFFKYWLQNGETERGGREYEKERTSEEWQKEIEEAEREVEREDRWNEIGNKKI